MRIPAVVQSRIAVEFKKEMEAIPYAVDPKRVLSDVTDRCLEEHWAAVERRRDALNAEKALRQFFDSQIEYDREPALLHTAHRLG